MHAFGARHIRPIHDLDYNKPILQFSPRRKEDKSLSRSKNNSKNPENVSQYRVKLTKSSSTSRNIIEKGMGSSAIKLQNYAFKNTS